MTMKEPKKSTRAMKGGEITSTKLCLVVACLMVMLALPFILWEAQRDKEKHVSSREMEMLPGAADPPPDALVDICKQLKRSNSWINWLVDTAKDLKRPDCLCKPTLGGCLSPDP
ncbi:hypothetical protein EYF80_016206 [Liparis tanakae]|uniref:Uncharacterized protein n=1 Tax=Liparis tanakae TaxID=230148 RepID=A0A4Z2I767_9TELE|nr:hypothetical protein EYF80_016206 [Liparis tanakae]